MKGNFISFLACWLFSATVFGQVLNESFDATTVPAGWTNTAVFGGPWAFSTSPGWGVAGTPDHTGNGGNYAWVDFSGNDTTVVLTAPSVEVTTLTTPYLEFAYESYVSSTTFAGPYNLLMIEAWNGTTWANVTTLQGNTPQGWEVTGFSLAGFTYSSGDSVRVRFVAESGGNPNDFENDLLIDDVMIKEAPTCLTPNQLAANNITGTTADLTWAIAGMPMSWEVTYGASGAPAGSGVTATTMTNMYNATGLSGATSYDYYVRAICGPGDTSAWAGPFAFTTPCVVFTPAYVTDFTTFLPNCWEEADNGNPMTGPTGLGTGSWGQAGTSARVNLFTTTLSEWLLSPEFDLSVPGPWELVLNTNATDFSPTTAFGGMGSDDTVQVVISTNGGATWRAIYTWDVNNPLQFASNDVVIDLTPYTGTSNLFGIWASDGSVNDPEDYYVLINRFEIRMPPSCDAPSFLTASNITATTAELGWTYTGPATVWEVSYGAPGTPAGAGVTATTMANPYNATGLNAASPYEFYARTICGPGDTSAWAGPFAFTTPCAVFTPAYTTDFTTFLPTCWEEADNGNPMTGPTGLGTGSWGQAGTSARVNLFTTTLSEWLLSPEFDLSVPGPWELVLNTNATDFSPTTAFGGMGSDDTVQVVISTNGGATWRAIYTWDVNNPLQFASNDVVIDLTPYSGTSNLFGIWASDGSVNDPEDYYVLINRFEIRMPPSCDAPSFLTASNVTATTAELGWTYTGPATVWEVSYGAPGTPAGAGVTATTMANPYNATGLNAASPYEFYARTICGPGDTSTWAGPFAFTTPCGVYTPNYTTDFTTFLPTCWEEASNGNPTTGPTGLGTGSWGQAGTSARVNLYSDFLSEWLLSPEFDLSAPGPWELVLNTNATDFSPTTAFGGMGSDDTVQVVISTDGGATWAPIYTWDVNNPLAFAANNVVIDLSAYTSTSNLFGIWASDGSVNDPEDYYVLINNFEIRQGMPAPPQFSDLVITEIMYNSPEGGVDSLEFIEIQNTGVAPIDLNNVSFGSGVTYTFPMTILAPGAFYTVAFNGAAFNNIYGLPANGIYTGGLSNNGETIILVDPMGNIIDSVRYDDGGVWPGGGTTQGSPDGGGASLVLCDATTDNADGANWSASTNSIGVTINTKNILASPGAANNCTAAVDVAVDTLLVDDTYCNVSAISGAFVVTNNSSVDASNVTYTATLDQVIIGTGTIATLAANSSDTILVGPVPVSTGSGVIEVIVSVTGDIDPNNDALNKTVYVSNIDASIMNTAMINCNGDSTGAMMASTVDAYGISTYLWNTGDATAAISNLAAGTYTVVATDSISCTDTAMMVLTEPTAIVITGAASNVACNGDSTGNVMIGVTGGTAPYTYLWSNGGTSVDLLNLPAGTYTVTVTDANGCMAMETYTVTEPTALTMSIMNNNDGSATAMAAGGSAPYTYLWSDGQATDTATNLMNNVTYMVTVTDSLGCTTMDSINITFINVNTIDQVNSLTMFPNPTSGQVFVDLALATTATVQINITNAIGQLVSSQALGTIQTQRVELSTQDLPDGLYLVQFQIGEEQVTRKLIVRRQ
ncbi:MAG: fibronectin type III domain-containing protein [Aureispira sp.]